MFKKKKLSEKQILIFVRLINVSKKFLVFLAILGQLVSVVPQRIVHAQTPTNEKEEVIDIESDDKIDNNIHADVTRSDIPEDIEVESMRSLNEKVFRKLDGSYEVSIYPDIVHYMENGKFKDIDNTLVEETKSIYNSSNNYDIKFPKEINSNDKIELKYNDYIINWRLINTKTSSYTLQKETKTKDNKKELSKLESTIKYENVLDNTDLEYVLTGSKIKENIYVNKYTENIKFIFEYDVTNLVIVNENGKITFKNNIGDVVYSFSGLFMIDSEQNISENIKLLSKQISENIYEISIIPDDEWLKSAVYPVLIDPTIINPTIPMSLVDTYVSKDKPTTNNHTKTVMKIGDISSKESQGLIKFNLPTLLDNQVITYAHIAFARTSVQTSPFQINIYKNTSNFNVSTVTWNNGKPTYNSNVIDYVGNNTSNIAEIFDVTKTVKEWQAGISENYGFTLAADDLTGAYREFFQYDNIQAIRPIIRIGFESPAGLKDYWTYTSQDIGQVGTGFISDYTGNLTFVRNDYQVKNEFSSLSLTFLYSNTNKNQNIGYGNGWKTNFNMKVESDSTINRFYLSKPDGNKVYFTFLDSTYEDGYDYVYYLAEDGSRMKLEIDYYGTEVDLIQITSIDNITYRFDNTGRLVSISDGKSFQQLFVTYISSTDRINYISDSVGNRIVFTYTLYGSNYLMTKTELKLKQAGSNSYNIVEDKTYTYTKPSIIPNLSKITQRFNRSGSLSFSYSQGDTLSYQFSNDSMLLGARNDSSKYGVSYTYDSINRVSSAVLNDDTLPTSNISKVDIVYNHGKTKYINHKNEWIEYLFDTYGHTINTLDSNGNAVYRRYAGLFTNNLNYESGLGDAQYINYHPNYYIVHALLESSEMMKQQINYINNHGFENMDSELLWEKYGTGTIERVYTESALGVASLKVNGPGTVYAYQHVYLKSGVYTLQGIIKNTNETITNSSSISVITSSGIYTESTNVVNEWTNLEIQFNLTSDQFVTVKLLNERNNSDTYFDNISLTEGFIDTRYNRLSDSSFEEGVGNWNLNNASIINNSQTGANENILGKKAISILGDGDSNKYFYQDITGYVAAGETYVIGGWAKANAVPHKSSYINNNGYSASDGRFFGLYVLYEYYSSDNPSSDNPDSKTIYIPFNTSTDEWQYQMRSFTLNEHQIVRIIVYGKYIGEGVAYFDNIQLYNDKLSTDYSYNLENGYLDSITSNSGVVTSYERDNKGHITNIKEGEKNIEINYALNNISEINSNNVKTVFTYNSSSRQITETLIGDTGIDGEWFKTSVTYSTDKQYITSQTDEYGNSTTINTNPLNGLIETVTNANNHIKTYEYDNYGQLINQVEEDISNQYTIVKDFTYDTSNRLSSISIDGINYVFNYDSLDRITKVKISNIDYVTLEYVSEQYNSITYSTGKVNKQTYGNGDIYSFIYTKDDQIKQVILNNEIYFEYVYDQSGRLTIYKDVKNNNIFFYSYDLIGRVKQIVDKQGNRINYTYDTQGNVNNYTYEFEDMKREVYYYFDDETGDFLYTFYELDDKIISKSNHINIEDSLKRVAYIELLIGNVSFTENITFDSPNVGRGNTSTRVSSITYKKDGVTEVIHNFNYDNLGNIIEISILNSALVEIENYQYFYDGFNRLIRENVKTIDYQMTFVYTYDNYSDSNTSYIDTNTNDNRGNITSIKQYTYTTSTVITGNPLNETKLFYKLSGWKDQLTRVEEYQNNNLVKTSNYLYDEIGNLLEISSNSDELFEWEGRRLTKHTINGVSYIYTYDDNGIRTSKSNDSNRTDYFLDGSLVLSEKTGNEIIYYTYDFDGSILSMNYQGNEYFYIKNIQGDIIEIVNELGNTVAKYRYDAWGNIIYEWDSGLGIASINPYRYRSYRLDLETGLYYLQSRYYNPTIGRFISADSINYLDPSSEQGLNLYAYTNNNPVMYLDSDGYAPKWISSIGGWFKDNWKEVLIGTAFVVAGAIVTGLTAGAGTTFWAAMGSALLTSTVQVGAGIAVGIGVNGLKNISKGENFFNNIEDTIASSYMWGGIFSGGSQMISGAFRSLKSTFGFNGISNNKFALGSPDKLFYDIPGATLFRFGSRNGLRLAVDTGRYGLHMHIYGKAHIWLIPEIVGVIEYFRNK